MRISLIFRPIDVVIVVVKLRVQECVYHFIVHHSLICLGRVTCTQIGRYDSIVAQHEYAWESAASVDLCLVEKAVSDLGITSARAWKSFLWDIHWKRIITFYRDVIDDRWWCDDTHRIEIGWLSRENNRSIWFFPPPLPPKLHHRDWSPASSPVVTSYKGNTSRLITCDWL